ncbi:hypothetical protein ABT158_01475 [Nonomuraea sp. NPDC001636]|uniref:hypothetical protein n=1 Tax=Nonomuraea sp. NPDC001636 TaxID=3154391 RepID=UPI0033276EDB
MAEWRRQAVQDERLEGNFGPVSINMTDTTKALGCKSSEMAAEQYSVLRSAIKDNRVAIYVAATYMAYNRAGYPASCSSPALPRRVAYECRGSGADANVYADNRDGIPCSLWRRIEMRGGGLESFDGVSDPVVRRMQEQRRLAAAHENSRVARIAMGVLTGSLGVLASLAGLVPTNHNWDPSMPDYSDPDLVMIATTASGFAILLFMLAVIFLWRSKTAVAFLLLFLVGDIYRFVTVVPHYTG